MRSQPSLSSPQRPRNGCRLPYFKPHHETCDLLGTWQLRSGIWRREQGWTSLREAQRGCSLSGPVFTGPVSGRTQDSFLQTRSDHAGRGPVWKCLKPCREQKCVCSTRPREEFYVTPKPSALCLVSGLQPGAGVFSHKNLGRGHDSSP